MILTLYPLFDMRFRRGVITALPFPCLIQRLYDKVVIPEIQGVDERVQVMTKEQTKMIKDLEHILLQYL